VIGARDMICSSARELVLNCFCRVTDLLNSSPQLVWCHRELLAPITKKIKKPKARWLKPELLVDVEYRALTGVGKVRHPSFKGIREDL
jgi:ATP-dependent DNA ligase